MVPSGATASTATKRTSRITSRKPCSSRPCRRTRRRHRVLMRYVCVGHAISRSTPPLCSNHCLLQCLPSRCSLCLTSCPRFFLQTPSRTRSLFLNIHPHCPRLRTQQRARAAQLPVRPATCTELLPCRQQNRPLTRLACACGRNLVLVLAERRDVALQRARTCP